MRSLLLAVAVALTGAGACSAPRGGVAAPQTPVTLLKHVPADTPYFYTSLQAAPPALIANIYRNARPMMSSYLDYLAGSRHPFGRLLHAWLEAMGDFSATTLDGLGIGAKPIMVVYAQGVWPVLRWRVDDPKKVEALLARVAGSAAATQQKMGDTVYYTTVEDDGEVAFGVAGGDLVATLIPTTQANDVLPFVIGDKLPERPLAEAQVQKIAAAHDVSELGVGWIDVARIVAIFLDTHDPLREELTRAGIELPAPSAGCRTELGLLADAMPRIVGGVSQLDQKVLATNLDAELSPLAQALIRPLAVELPPVPESLGGILAGTVGANLPRLRELLAHPLSCELLHEVNEAGEGLEELLEEPQSVAPAIKGVGFVLKKLDLHTKSFTPSVSGAFVVTTTGPSDLLEMADKLWGGIASAPLLDDGKAVPVVTQLSVLGKTSIALKGSNVGIAFGDGMEHTLETIVGAPPELAPFVKIRVDTLRFISALKSTDRDLGRLKPWAGEARFELGPSPSGLRLHYEVDLPSE
jgi:hypothetical protein